MDLKVALQTLKAYKADRQKLADKVINQKNLFKELLRYSFSDDSQVNYRACWILEYVCIAKLQWIYQHLDLFIEQLPRLENESSKRSCAKVCELLCREYYLKQDEQVREAFTTVHLEKLTTICFDWLISETKVATKAYAMECLQLLGADFNWIHPELTAILHKGIPEHSMAYTARARHILNKI